MKEILVKDAPALSTIEIKTAGSFDPDCTRYIISSHQDISEKIRARNYHSIVYLHPLNICRVIK
jgi:hypothetical protein